MRMTRGWWLAFAAGVALLLGGSVQGAEGQPELGPETNLPLPRFVSLKSTKAYIRRGPGLTHRIDWIFVREGMPLEIIAEHGHWRKVRDVDDATGWVHHALLRGQRSAVVTVERGTLRSTPSQSAKATAMAEAGVIVAVEGCAEEWCEVSKGDHHGWIRKTEIWGAGPDEVFK